MPHLATLAPLTESTRHDWLRLSRAERVGPITFFRLLDRFGTAAKALEALPELAKKGGGAVPKIPTKSEIDKELAAAAKAGLTLLAAAEPTYPALLRAIDDAPPLIYVAGHTALLEMRAVSIVGARNASLNGRRMAEDLGRALAADGLVVVSGLARGIDTAAHTGALQGGTIAVLAGGADVVYPPENQALYDKIRGLGAIVAEQPPGVEPQARHFPRRNRIISGLSLATIVVEAALQSGSLITAREAADQGREVMAVPGSPLDPRCRGCNALLRDGAVLVEEAQDVLRALASTERLRHMQERQPDLFAPAPPRLDEGEIDRARPIVIELLGPSPCGIDEIIRACQLSPAAVHAVLLELDLAGRLERQPGQRVALIG